MSYSVATTDSYGWDMAFPIVAGSSGLDWEAPYDYALPGYVVNGWQNGTADGTMPDFVPTEAYAWGTTGALTTDPTVGSMPGEVNRLPYAAGPVDSNLVEDFTMTGAYISIRRKAEASSGPVGYMDYSGILAGALAQANANSYSTDRMNAELLMSI